MKHKGTEKKKIAKNNLRCMPAVLGKCDDTLKLKAREMPV